MIPFRSGAVTNFETETSCLSDEVGLLQFNLKEGLQESDGAHSLLGPYGMLPLRRHLRFDNLNHKRRASAELPDAPKT